MFAKLSITYTYPSDLDTKSHGDSIRNSGEENLGNRQLDGVRGLKSSVASVRVMYTNLLDSECQGPQGFKYKMTKMTSEVLSIFNSQWL